MTKPQRINQYYTSVPWALETLTFIKYSSLTRGLIHFICDSGSNRATDANLLRLLKQLDKDIDARQNDLYVSARYTEAVGTADSLFTWRHRLVVILAIVKRGRSHLIAALNDPDVPQPIVRKLRLALAVWDRVRMLVTIQIQRFGIDKNKHDQRTSSVLLAKYMARFAEAEFEYYQVLAGRMMEEQYRFLRRIGVPV